MADIDLIPKQYLLRKLVQRRLKLLAIALLTLGCVVGAARAALWYGASHEQQEIARLRKNEVDSAQMKARMQDYEQQKATVEKQLKALADVRGRGRTHQLLAALDAAYLPGVWFDEVRSHRAAALQLPTEAVTAMPKPAASATPAPAQAAVAATVPAPRVKQRVELVGHAIDHSRLASLMTRLSAQPAVSDVQLLDTTTRTYSTATIIDFTVSLAVSEKERP
jgi:hypothetical protein